MSKWIKNIISTKRYILLLYIIFALVASLLSIFAGTKKFQDAGPEYTYYNNYVIFKKSFYHLQSDQDLYISYPQEHWDLYKYTPTFSVFFSVFAICPDWIGLSLWNLLNALILLFAIYYLPRISMYEKALILLIVLIELMTSLQNAQSNGLIAGLLVFSFGLLENKKYLLATLCIVLSAFIKIFGIVGLVLFIFYPHKWKLALYTILWTVVCLMVPFACIDFDQYSKIVESYQHMLAMDHSSSYGYSIMGWLNSWFGVSLNKNIIVLLGVVVFLIPYARWQQYTHFAFRNLALASVLIWIVIFNHKAESPTFIIAMTGVALWYVASDKSIFDTSLFAFAFIFTTLSPTDIFPPFLRNEYVVPYTLKALPCIIIWLKIIYEMMVSKNESIPTVSFASSFGRLS